MPCACVREGGILLWEDTLFNCTISTGKRGWYFVGNVWGFLANLTRLPSNGRLVSINAEHFFISTFIRAKYQSYATDWMRIKKYCCFATFGQVWSCSQKFCLTESMNFNPAEFSSKKNFHLEFDFEVEVWDANAVCDALPVVTLPFEYQTSANRLSFQPISIKNSKGEK